MADPAPKIDGPDVYPWEWPTPEQKAWFDALPVDEQWRLVDEMLEEIDQEPAVETLDWDKIKARALARLNDGD
jgi:acyl dehydratase